MSIELHGLNALLAELRAGASLARGEAASAIPDSDGNTSFAEALKRQIDKVNAVQERAHEMAQAYITGDSNVTLQDVMIRGQQADLAFMQLVRTKEKLVSAYSDIMNMAL